MARKHGAMPTVAISTPARAGPITRAMLMVTELSVMALPRSFSGTISAMKLCLVGLSKTLTKPERQRDDGDHPQRDDVGGDECRPAPTRADPGQRLGHIEDPPLVEPVGDQAAPRGEEHHREEPGRRNQAEIGPTAGQP